MRIISILRQDSGQTIPRPFARVSSLDELVELLRPYLGNNVATSHIDTEQPLGMWRDSGGYTVWFYAFTEPDRNAVVE